MLNRVLDLISTSWYRFIINIKCSKQSESDARSNFETALGGERESMRERVRARELGRNTGGCICRVALGINKHVSGYSIFYFSFSDDTVPNPGLSAVSI